MNSNNTKEAVAKNWSALFQSQFLKDDLVSGVIVACTAIPLSLAIAMASSVPPSVGLISAIVGGLVCAIFGGNSRVISGPSAAMAIFVGSVIQNYGADALLVIILGCGILQVLSGVLNVGQLIRFVPIPVVGGFTAGIGAIILVSQLPRAMGLPAPDQAHTISVITHIGTYVDHTQFVALALSLGTLLITIGLPYVSRKIPAPFVALVIMTAIAGVFGLDVETMGSIPKSFPLPHFPTWPKQSGFYLVESSFIFFILASLDSLVTSSSIDKLAKVSSHEPSRELIGQGLGNLSSALFAGIPVTGDLVRSTLNLKTGVRTRRSGVIHSLFILAAMLGLAPWLEKIPVAVLAGVLFYLALKMLKPREFIYLWKFARSEAFIYGITFLVIVFMDLVAGVQAGIVSALAILAFRLSQMRSHFHESAHSGPSRFSINGSITFMASGKIEAIRKRILSLDPQEGVGIDMSRVSMIDSSGAEQMIELVDLALANGNKIALQGVSKTLQKMLIAADKKGNVSKTFAVTETEVHQLLNSNENGSPVDRLVFGVERFRNDAKSHYQPLFDRLAESQSPHTLFITCSDSRINPTLITSTDPGELFIIRNVGNIIPTYGHDSTPAEGAALEFAIEVLKVKEIVVCAHSQCGAMKALVSVQGLSETSDLGKWLSQAAGNDKLSIKGMDPDEASRRNALIQIENIKTYPIIKKYLEKGSIRLHAWFYEIGNGEIEEWNSKMNKYVPVGRLE